MSDALDKIIANLPALSAAGVSAVEVSGESVKVTFGVAPQENGASKPSAPKVVGGRSISMDQLALAHRR